MGRPVYPADHYASRLDRVRAYIEANLEEPLLLTELAREASFSCYHFHRIFCEWYGETPQSYVRRQRLERSAALLRYGPGTRVADIANQCGFISAEAFDRAFRGYFGMTPTCWRGGGHTDWHVRTTPLPETPSDLCSDHVCLKRLAAVQTVYQRKVGRYGVDEVEIWFRLSRLVMPFGIGGQTCYAVGLDDPAVTPAERCRLDVSIALPSTVKVPARIPVKLIAGGPHAILPYSGPAGAAEGHWLWLLRTWLPQSGYRVSQHACFERFPDGIPGPGIVHSELCLPLVRKG